MSEKRRGLGRGLGALIPSSAAPVTRPAGEQPVDVFFRDREDGGAQAEGAGPDVAAVATSPSNLTVLPGGRTVAIAPPAAAPSFAPPQRPAPGVVAPSVGGVPSTGAGAPATAPAARWAPPPASAPAVPSTAPAAAPTAPAAAPTAPAAAPTAPAAAPTAPAAAPTAPVAPASTTTLTVSPATPVAPSPQAPGTSAPAVTGPAVTGPAAVAPGAAVDDRVPSGSPASEPAPSDVMEGEGTGPGDSAPGATGASGDEGLVPVPGVSFAELPVGTIRPNPRQPRQVFDEEELAELVHSIREVGVLQPVVVRRAGGQDGEPHYELIMGERRLRAARDAGLERIPAIVRDTQDDALLRDALLENLHRSQLNPLEEAAAYQQLLDDFGCTHEELATRIGRSRPQISNTLRLLKLPALVQRRVAAGVLSAGHARALLGLEDPAGMERLAQRIVSEGLSVRAVEEIVALGDGPPAKGMKRRPRAGSHTSELDDLAARLGDRLDTRVAIALGRSKGRLSIDFASVEDLNRIIGLLGPDMRGVFRQQ